ncbi:MAG: transaldolase family protein [Planctomycetota bacterium]
MTPLESLVSTGTKLWLDSVDPVEVEKNLKYGATGATSNPIIIAGILGTGDHDAKLSDLLDAGHDDTAIAWAMTDYLVANAQKSFHPVWQKTACNDGWVSFELDPLLEDVELGPAHDDRVAAYIKQGKQANQGHDNRMIKVPATPAGLDALEELAAHGITLNVTLIFSDEQYHAAREAVWKGRQRFGQLDTFKSVYSIFVSRVDAYTDKHYTNLSDDAQGEVGLLNTKRIWHDNQAWWADKGLKLDQEIIFASTGAKLDWQAPDYYPARLAGSDIQTNPPATNDAIQELGKSYAKTVGDMPSQAIQDEIDAKVDQAKMTADLMEEGLAKFADPFKKLLASIKDKRAQLAST